MNRRLFFAGRPLDLMALVIADYEAKYWAFRSA